MRRSDYVGYEFTNGLLYALYTDVHAYGYMNYCSEIDETHTLPLQQVKA